MTRDRNRTIIIPVHNIPSQHIHRKVMPAMISLWRFPALVSPLLFPPQHSLKEKHVLLIWSGCDRANFLHSSSHSVVSDLGTKTVMATHKCSGYCQITFACCQGLSCFSLCAPSKQCKGTKEVGKRQTKQMIQTDHRYSMLCNVVNKNWKRRGI